MGRLKDIIDRLCFDRIKNDKIIERDVNEYNVDKKLIGYECIICLEGFNEGDTVSLIRCGHMYHTQCLYTWFNKKKSCPLCCEELIID
tara:strand:- start:70 stop:333 length:264 start_codon:yes stop_codon:yes gene_type:complete